MSGREVAIAVDENATHNEHRIVLRRYPLHPGWHLSFPAGPCNEVVARLCARRARADIREVDVKRVGELYAVVAAGEVGHAEDLRLAAQVEPADHNECVSVHASRCQFRSRGGWVERIRKKGLGFRVKRIDRNGTLADPLADDCLLVDIVHKVRPKIDEEESAYCPC